MLPKSALCLDANESINDLFLRLFIDSFMFHTKATTTEVLFYTANEAFVVTNLLGRLAGIEVVNSGVYDTGSGVKNS